VSTTVFQTFSCEPIDDFATVKTSYLRADYSIQCGTSEYKLYRGIAILMIFIYPVGIPVFFSWLLYTTKQHHNNTESGAPQHMTNSIVSATAWQRMVKGLKYLRDLVFSTDVIVPYDERKKLSQLKPTRFL
jgi:hypothetical protein